MMLTIIIPTRNEAPNIEHLICRTAAACDGLDAELVFVDDSTDRTPELILYSALHTRLPVRLITRRSPTGGLSGAVADGIASSNAEYCLVMHGDLQHPPEAIPALLAEIEGSGADVVVAARGIGRPSGQDGVRATFRRGVSLGARALTRCLFPLRMRGCSDPMSGFFAIRRSAIDQEILRPSGFKILLEILARHRLRIREIPIRQDRRTAGASKARLQTGLSFVRQLGQLRAGTAFLFAIVGAVGALMNLMIMAFLHSAGIHYAVAATVAAELTILSNFIMQEHVVFGTLRDKVNGRRKRFVQSFSFNNLEALLRLPVLLFAVDVLLIDPIAAQAATLVGAFTLRYVFHAKIVYSSGCATSPALTRQSSEPVARINPQQATP